MLEWENWWADQPSYHRGPQPGLWVSPPQDSPYLCIAGTFEGARPVDLKLQDLHGVGQQRVNQEEPQRDYRYQWDSKRQRLGTEPKTHGNEHLQGKIYGLKGTLCDPLSHIQVSILLLDNIFHSTWSLWIQQFDQTMGIRYLAVCMLSSPQALQWQNHAAIISFYIVTKDSNSRLFAVLGQQAISQLGWT